MSLGEGIVLYVVIGVISVALLLSQLYRSGNTDTDTGEMPAVVILMTLAFWFWPLFWLLVLGSALIKRVPPRAKRNGGSTASTTALTSEPARRHLRLVQ